MHTLSSLIILNRTFYQDKGFYLSIVNLSIKLSVMFPSSMDAADHRGRYPMHVAVASGRMPSAIKYLVYARLKYMVCQDTHTWQDPNALCWGRLHEKVYRERQLQYAEVAPQSVNIKDEDEMNPIEVALLNGTHIQVNRSLAFFMIPTAETLRLTF